MFSLNAHSMPPRDATATHNQRSEVPGGLMSLNEHSTGNWIMRMIKTSTINYYKPNHSPSMTCHNLESVIEIANASTSRLHAPITLKIGD